MITQSSTAAVEFGLLGARYHAAVQAWRLSAMERALLLGRCLAAPLPGDRGWSPSGPEGARVRHVVQIDAAVTALLGDPGLRADWLRAPNAGLGFAAPLEEMLLEPDGVRLMRDRLVAERRTLSPGRGW